MKTLTIVVPACLLVAGAASAAYATRDHLPFLSSHGVRRAALVAPVSNREAKHDRLMVALTAALPPDPRPTAVPQSMRQAFASDSAVNMKAADIAAAMAPKVAMIDPTPDVVAAPEPEIRETPRAAEPPAESAKRHEPARRKVEAKAEPKAPRTAAEKAYALLSDPQIAKIRERLRLSPDQEAQWPAVETALKAVARRIHADHLAHPRANEPVIDPDWEEVQQLKSAAMPMLFSLRDDQKSEVRSLARLMGLTTVAAMI